MTGRAHMSMMMAMLAAVSVAAESGLRGNGEQSDVFRGLDSLEGVDIDYEYGQILQKRCGLPAEKRREVVRRWQEKEKTKKALEA